MIIIKPDLVIKWANSNLVLHRVREHLCVFLRFPAPPYVFTFLNILGLESLNMHVHCVCEAVWQGESAAEERHIYKDVWLGMETAIIFLLAKRRRRKKHTQTFPHPFSFSSLFSILHSLCSASPSLFLYHLQRQPFPPKWGHVRKVCKWNHCSWIRMGHHIP